MSFFCRSARIVCTRPDQFEIRKNVPQNKPIAVLTKRLSHEFRNKTESPRATSVKPSMRILRSAGEPGCIGVVVCISPILSFVKKLTYRQCLQDSLTNTHSSQL